ncbi:MraY family glycosyltransferase [Accumulibacter sp.]|uniref:MraY family glycosyltransferase n=1 Tax=Accumulibacter sp. TaxID=2053492 RepID=UPI0025CD1923|nr:MraY family glycosyltransferase [Accumulibacter sp.]MCM8594280.1 undecaprenyl/decaprenyl-phosphate alpha-N-acetylglucosaminyl 1-phosphate transferase [Accumulibacter sp.]MCM8627897.1 undecaprenyl/decaprenyl-phosphate alpha-N-acetylglucosaminyl 1-phosphate transferase [Accumulibacter sp.]MDS4048424.1 MraY family glycosyltransferase [Accumulibacter sp.]
MEFAVLFGACLLISAAVIAVAAALARQLGIVDRPGGHKLHVAVTPFVGGFGVFAVLVCAMPVARFLSGGVAGGLDVPAIHGILLAAGLVFVTGLADDVWLIGFKPRLVVHALAALWMVYVGDVQLRSLGELFPDVDVDLGVWGLPLTVFATIGLINAMNMIDGIDGLAGSVGLVSLALLGLVTGLGGGGPYLVLIVALIGGLAGFLFFNLRYPGNPRARVFLGDNGSMLIGFLLAWLFIALSQGEERAVMTPVTALWLFAVPLLDTVAVMLRRLWMGRSPFRADRHHLHHLFARAGFRVCDIVAFAAFMQLVFGFVGIAGLLLGVPESVMFGLFLGVFAAYTLVILRPWRLVPWLRRVNRRFGWPSVQVRGIFVGYLRKDHCPELVRAIAAGLGNRYDYQLSVYELDRSASDGRNAYCVVHIRAEGDEQLIGRIRRDAQRLKEGIGRRHGVDVRLYMGRNKENDSRRVYAPIAGGGSRIGDRRGLRASPIYCIERGGCAVFSDRQGFELSVPPAGR